MMLNGSGGYRAGKEDPLGLKIVGVKFKKETVITGVATQGYGNGDDPPYVQEWVTEYILKFVRQEGGEEEYILDSQGKPKVTVRFGKLALFTDWNQKGTFKAGVQMYWEVSRPEIRGCQFKC